jgi:hypothetical protein
VSGSGRGEFSRFRISISFFEFLISAEDTEE